MIDDDLKLGDERTTLMRSSSLILLACYISVEGGVETEHHLSLLQTAASAVRQSPGESEAEAQDVEEQIQADESMEDQPQANIPEDEEPSDACGSAASMLDARTQLLQEQKDSLNESKATMKQLRQMLKQEQDLIKDQMNSEGCEIADGSTWIADGSTCCSPKAQCNVVVCLDSTHVNHEEYLLDFHDWIQIRANVAREVKGQLLNCDCPAPGKASKINAASIVL